MAYLNSTQLSQPYPPTPIVSPGPSRPTNPCTNMGCPAIISSAAGIDPMHWPQDCPVQPLECTACDAVGHCKSQCTVACDFCTVNQLGHAYGHAWWRCPEFNRRKTLPYDHWPRPPPGCMPLHAASWDEAQGWSKRQKEDLAPGSIPFCWDPKVQTANFHAALARKDVRQEIARKLRNEENKKARALGKKKEVQNSELQPQPQPPSSPPRPQRSPQKDTYPYVRHPLSKTAHVVTKTLPYNQHSPVYEQDNTGIVMNSGVPANGEGEIAGQNFIDRAPTADSVVALASLNRTSSAQPGMNSVQALASLGGTSSAQPGMNSAQALASLGRTSSAQPGINSAQAIPPPPWGRMNSTPSNAPLPWDGIPSREQLVCHRWNTASQRFGRPPWGTTYTAQAPAFPPWAKTFPAPVIPPQPWNGPSHPIPPYPGNGASSAQAVTPPPSWDEPWDGTLLGLETGNKRPAESEDLKRRVRARFGV